MNYEKSAAYIVEIEEWRAQQDIELRAPDSWLSLTGLYILKDGYHTIGSNSASDIRLPTAAPDHLGIIAFSNGKTRLNVASSEHVLVDGQPVLQADLLDNSEGQKSTLVSVGTITFFVHKFGDFYAIRVKDSANPAIQAFPGRQWFAIKPEYRVHARFIPHETPRVIPIKTIVDTNTKYNSVGTVEFILHEQKLVLLAVARGSRNQLQVVFRDATSGIETYGPARCLSVEVNGDGRAIVDFNQAYNPPCAFSVYATCPLPPRDNILAVAIEAGERLPRTKAVGRAEPELSRAIR